MRAGKEYEIWHIKDEERLHPLGSLNEGALIYINSRSKAFHNKLGLAYGQGAGNLDTNWSQDFYICNYGRFTEQVPTQRPGDWKLPKPDGRGLTVSGLAHWKDEETEIMKNLNYFIENYEVVRIFDDEMRSLDLLKKLLMILKDSKNPAYMKPIYFHFLGSGVSDGRVWENGVLVPQSSLGINKSEIRDIEEWCESMSYQGFNVNVKYHYMESPKGMLSEELYVARDGSGPYWKRFPPRY
jgi:hypothetical protein